MITIQVTVPSSILPNVTLTELRIFSDNKTIRRVGGQRYKLRERERERKKEKSKRERAKERKRARK